MTKLHICLTHILYFMQQNLYSISLGQTKQVLMQKQYFPLLFLEAQTLRNCFLQHCNRILSNVKGSLLILEKCVIAFLFGASKSNLKKANNFVQKINMKNTISAVEIVSTQIVVLLTFYH